MTRCEGTTGTGVLHESEVAQVRAGTELVVSCGVAVIHEYPRILIDELEDTGTLDSLGGLLERRCRLRPLAAQRFAGTCGEVTSGDLADATLALVLIEAVIEGVALVVDDVHIDGGRAAVVEIDGLAIEVGEVVVGVTVEVFIEGDSVAAACTQREVDHEALCLVVPNGLGCPDADDLLEHRAAILIREVHGRVSPMNEIGGFHHDDASVGIPSFSTAHVGVDHVEHAVGASQDVRIAHAALQGNGVGSHDSPSVVEGCEIIAVVGDGIVEILVVVGREIDKEIVLIGLVLVERDDEIARQACLALQDCGSERDVALLSLRKFQDASLVGNPLGFGRLPEYHGAVLGNGR